jgi:hypothetical protein
MDRPKPPRRRRRRIRESLSAEQQALARFIYRRLAKGRFSAFERWEFHLLRQPSTDRELFSWMRLVILLDRLQRERSGPAGWETEAETIDEHALSVDWQAIAEEFPTYLRRALDESDSKFQVAE